MFSFIKKIKEKSKSKINLLFCFLLLTAGSASSFANSANKDSHSLSAALPVARAVASEEEFRPHVGVLFGLTNPEGAYQATPEIGMNIGFQPYIPFGLGLQLEHFSSQSRSEEKNLNRTLVLANGSYNFGGSHPFIKHSYLGVGLGLSMGSGKNQIAAAPMLGFDIPILTKELGEGHFSAGALAKYTVVEGSNPDSFSFNGVIKYWF